ncbi:MAG: SMI1/KNR4 family protein [Fluviicola sp.]
MIQKINSNFLLEKSFFDKIEFDFTESFKEFYKYFNGFSFVGNVGIKSMSDNAIASKGEFISVDYFYSLEIENDDCILTLLNDLSDQLPKGLIPFCDGYFGDFICINLNQGIDYGKIFYWIHDDEENGCFCLSNDFTSFVLSLEKFEEKNDLKNKKVETPNVKPVISRELFDLLIKNGNSISEDDFEIR